MQAVVGCLRNTSRIIVNNTGHQALQLANRRPNIDIIRTMSSTPTYTAEYLSDKLKKELEAEHVDIVDLSNCGCGMKFDAVLVSPKFENKPILQRQRLVNQILAEEMKYIHAFTMRTLTPAIWKEQEKERNKASGESALN